MNGRLCCTYAGGYASIGTIEYYYLSMKYNRYGGDVEEMRAAAGPPISIQLICGDACAEVSSILYGVYVLKLVVCVFVCLLQRLMHMHAVWCCSAMPSAGTSFIADTLEPLPAISQVLRSNTLYAHSPATRRALLLLDILVAYIVVSFSRVAKAYNCIWVLDTSSFTLTAPPTDSLFKLVGRLLSQWPASNSK